MYPCSGVLAGDVLDARLIRRRSGRSVLYDRTPAGDTLIQAQPEGSG